jgi:hypothetical protein
VRCEDTCTFNDANVYNTANDGRCGEPDGENSGLSPKEVNFCDAGTDCTDCTAYRSRLACVGIECGHYYCDFGECSTEECAPGWTGEVRATFHPGDTCRDAALTPATRHCPGLRRDLRGHLQVRRRQ